MELNNEMSITDIVQRAMTDKKMPVLLPIIAKYDKEYKGVSMTGQKYDEYVGKVFKEYMTETQNDT